MILGQSPLGETPLGDVGASSGGEPMATIDVVAFAPEPLDYVLVREVSVTAPVPKFPEHVRRASVAVNAYLPAAFNPWRDRPPTHSVSVETQDPATFVTLAWAPRFKVSLKAPSFGVTVDKRSGRVASRLASPSATMGVVPLSPEVFGRLVSPYAEIGVSSSVPDLASTIPGLLATVAVSPAVSAFQMSLRSAGASVALSPAAGRPLVAPRTPMGLIWVEPGAAWERAASVGVVSVMNAQTTGVSEYSIPALDVAVLDGEVYFLTETGVTRLSYDSPAPSGYVETGDIWFTPGTNCNVPRTELLLHSEGNVYLTATCDANPVLTTTYQVPERTGEWERARAVRMGRGARGNDWRLKVSTNGGDWRLQGMSALVEQVGRPR